MGFETHHQHKLAAGKRPDTPSMLQAGKICPNGDETHNSSEEAVLTLISGMIAATAAIHGQWPQSTGSTTS